MSAAPLPPFAQAWLAQYNNAAIELARNHANELRALTLDEALAVSEAVLDLVDPASLPSQRWTNSGLVEQQRIFMQFLAK